MADQQQTPNPDVEQFTFVSEVEPEAKPPPVLETGALLWVRQNLFSSVFNTILTFVGAYIIMFTLVRVTQWVVPSANWFVVTFNIRQLMVGLYEIEFLWRVWLTVYIVVFALGMGVAVWIKQVARTMAITFAVIFFSVLALPRMLEASIELPSFYMAAGEGVIESGSVSEQANSRVAFTGKGGEEITIRLATDVSSSEETLAELSGFGDVASNTLRNAAANRLDALAQNQAMQEEMELHLASEIPLLTERQVEENAAILEAFEEPAPIIETFSVNQITVQIQVLDADTLEPIGDMILLENPDDVASYTLPEDGWYILEKIDPVGLAAAEEAAAAAGEEEDTEEAPAANTQDVRNVSGMATTPAADSSVEESVAIVAQVAILDIQGIYPVLQSSSFDDETSSFVDTFIRMTDFYRLKESLPRNDAGDDMSFTTVRQNQYRGNRTFAEYLRTYVGPFLDRVSYGVTTILIAGIAGYFAVGLISMAQSPKMANSLTSYLLGLTPIIIWILINGMYALTATLWGGVAAVAMVSLGVYRMGKSNGDITVTSVLALVFAGASLYTSTQVAEGGTIPNFLLQLAFIPLAAAVYLGKSAHIPGDEPEDNTLTMALINLGILTFAVVIYLVSSSITIDTEWGLDPSDARKWGGLLLVMMLTIYGIIAAFPIGVGLALGRRSDLPAIKWLCTAYIELIRGSPFITVLFFMQLIIPFISSDLAEVPNSYRAIVATIAFSAAYLAENVRGGLQSLPPGQAEAARALGLNAWQTTTLITLPQALRAVIPALVGQFIGLFKDTSLVSIVGLLDLVELVKSVVVQPEFIGTRLEGLFFISIIYFVVSYVMSYISRLLEASGSGSTRRI